MFHKRVSKILFMGGSVHSPWADTPSPPPRADHPPPQTRQTATESDGTHPTGMQSCYVVFWEVLTEK